jgi:tetratricopeptide (TPR) repeat protein
MAAPAPPPAAASPTDATPNVPKLNPERRAQIVKMFGRAKQVLATGNLDYAIELFVDCAKADPANLGFRQELRKTEKKKYGDNKKGKAFAFLSTWRTSFKLQTASTRKKHLQVIDLAEDVFLHNPWHTRASILQAHAFQELGLIDMALWTLDQARQAAPENHRVNRPMARLFEQKGQFTQAIQLWRLVHKKCPKDLEASKKPTALAASETISQGGYDDAAAGKGPSPIKKDKTGGHRVVAEGETASESLAMERIAKDENMLLKRIADQPANPLGYLQLGQLYRRNDMGDKAREVFQKGIAAIGQHFEIGLEISDLDIDPFRKDLAITEEKLRDDPKNADLMSKRDAQAKEINSRELVFFRTKSDRFPTDSSARYEMAVRLYQAGQPEAAINEFQKLRTDPKHKVRVLIYLGLCFIARNNWRLAQKNLEDGLSQMSAAEEHFRKDIMYHLACGYAANGELQKAIDLGSDLANIDYNFKDIGPKIEQWQAKKDKPKDPPPPTKKR